MTTTKRKAAKAADQAMKLQLTHEGISHAGNDGLGEYEWHNFAGEIQGSSEVAMLCVCIGSRGVVWTDLGTNDGGYWPASWPKDAMSEANDEAVRIAREHSRIGVAA